MGEYNQQRWTSLTHGATCLPAGSAATEHLGLSSSFAAWFQDVLTNWNAQDGWPMTLIGGKFGSASNSEVLTAEYGCSTADAAVAVEWVKNAFSSREARHRAQPSVTPAPKDTWQRLMAVLSPGTHLDRCPAQVGAANDPADDLAVLRTEYGSSSVVLDASGIDLRPPRRPWRPPLPALQSPRDVDPISIPDRVQRCHVALALPGLTDDGGRLAIAHHAALHLGGWRRVLAGIDGQAPTRAYFQVMHYWARSFVVGDLRFARPVRREDLRNILGILARPKLFGEFSQKATTYCLQMLLDDPRAFVKDAAVRLLHGAEQLEDFDADTDWRGVTESTLVLPAAVVAPLPRRPLAGLSDDRR